MCIRLRFISRPAAMNFDPPAALIPVSPHPPAGTRPDKAKSSLGKQCFLMGSFSEKGRGKNEPRFRASPLIQRNRVNLTQFAGKRQRSYCRSYSPLLTRLRTVNPAFFASEIESGLSFTGELNVERILRTGFLHAGHCVSGGAESGRRKVNLPPQTLQLPSQSSYS